ncbi:helical backbone metal receptor [Bacillus badius]|uniref:Vitamin B12 ABC transporter, B12-binding component BtuF n=1 Tax=Bacillus badius TaxID=1455 RepID=A0ABR5AQD6_BACBA|nr:helical backbone metal receptor [Bacillus badius]KIL72181.1 Vitamin B12 ABC transporter, B12-binding component BtuF [Bacillus badius]KIL76945.1 Vitamin B12 ABC transporter, B12-binding component BtuF [Bacillus badius]KZR58188.1 iron ABC transporter substrate-binding protein [Bacillus badius]MED4717723.1 helical backbone metal receptor [Bacillus badius]
MKKLSKYTLSFMLAAGLLAGCGSDKAAPEKEEKANQPKESEQAAFPVTVKDADGKEVVIEEKPKRIVSLIPSNTEIAYELDLDKEIVGVSDNDNYPKEVSAKEKVGGMEYNIEKIIGLDADLVLAHGSSAHNSKEGFKQLEEAGIDVLVVNDAQNFDEVYDSIKMIGKATGTSDKAEDIVTDMKEDLTEISEKAETIKKEEEKNVFIEVSPAPEIYTPGKNTFMQEMLDLIHAKNAAADQDGWGQMTEEAIIKKNPDVIITTHGYYTQKPVEEVLSRKGWETITAVKNKDVHDVHADLVNRTGPRLVEGVEELAEAIYPDVFKK